jgi:ABC-type branched-subunit amino acid transport system substrate-binding protein
MSASKKSLIGCVLAGVLLLAAAGCGSKGTDKSSSSGGGGGQSGAVKAGPGVTAKTITLGVLTDLSGVFAPLGKPTMQANQLFWKERNAQGGVCNRTVKLTVKDHGYDPQKAVVQYRELASNVAGLQQLLGSPITAALLPSLKSDQMVSLLAAWPSSLLPNDNIIITGTTYDVEMINGLDYLMQQGKLKQGDKIGHIYFEGEYGENGLKGSKFFAQKNGMTVVEQKIKATDEDMSGQVAALKRRGVKAIALTTAPTQLASVAGIGAAQGLDVPLVGNNPTFDPALLKTPAAKALKANAFVVSSIAPFNLGKPDVQQVASDYQEAYPKEVPKASAPFGYMQGKLMYEILNHACQNKDLTRAGIVKAAHQVKNLDTGGLTAAPLDYTSLGQPSERAVYIAQPADEPGGLKALPQTFESDTAKTYEVSGT